MGLAQAARQGIFCRDVEDESALPRMCLTCAKKEIRIRVAWNAWHVMEQFWKAKVNSLFKCNIFKATVQGAVLSGLLRKREPHRQ